VVIEQPPDRAAGNQPPVPPLQMRDDLGQRAVRRLVDQRQDRRGLRLAPIRALVATARQDIPSSTDARTRRRGAAERARAIEAGFPDQPRSRITNRHQWESQKSPSAQIMLRIRSGVPVIDGNITDHPRRGGP